MISALARVDRLGTPSNLPHCQEVALRNVLPLFVSRRARLAELRQWFAEQASEPSGHVAAVSVAITSDGMVNTSGRGIEPEHAAVILEELRIVESRLEAIVAGHAPTSREVRLKCQVIQLRPQSDRV